jgi:YihY family inner membrane protein
MAWLRKLILRGDAFQQGRTALALPVAVARKVADDEGGSLAALIAHYGLLSLFPLILVLSAVLGFLLGGNASLKAHVVSTVARSFPALSGYVTSSMKGSGLALGLGTVVALWAGLGVTRATERAMNAIWDVPLAERPSMLRSRLRGLGMLAILGCTFLASTGLASLQQKGGVPAAPVAALSILGPLVLNFGLYLLAFQVLTNRHLRWRTLAPGAAAGSAGWTLLQSLGALYVRHELAHASQLYGTLAAVIGLLAWLYLGALLTVYCAELNVVLDHRLWPRSLGRRSRTDADRRALSLLARRYERAAGEVVGVGFDEGAGETPPDGRLAAERYSSGPG